MYVSASTEEYRKQGTDQVVLRFYLRTEKSVKSE